MHRMRTPSKFYQQIRSWWSYLHEKREIKKCHFLLNSLPRSVIKETGGIPSKE